MKSSFCSRTIVILFLGIIFSALQLSQASGLTDNFESKHFHISYQEGVDPLGVAHQIKIDAYSVDGSKDNSYSGNTPEEILGNNIENLFDEVSDTLDMHLYSYKGNIRIYRNREELKKVLFDRFGRHVDYPAIYHEQGNTIYMSAEGLRVGILAHEMAHAIIDHYFVVKPPMRIQEVLAGFVEYTITKKLKKK